MNLNPNIFTTDYLPTILLPNNPIKPNYFLDALIGSNQIGYREKILLLIWVTTQNVGGFYIVKKV